MNEMTLTPEKLDEIERLAELTTPGPWELRDADNGPHIVARLPENEGKRWDDPVICNLYDDVTPEDSVTIGPWLEALPNALANARLIVALDPATVRELVRAARERDHQAARIAEREKPCVWTPEGEDSSSWNTGCGSSFWFDDGHEGVNFCPFCGHPAVFDHEGDEA